MNRQTIERERVAGFMHELNLSGFSNVEIALQVGRSVSFVEKCLRGRKGLIWRLPSTPPATRRWHGGSQVASMRLKALKLAVGRNLCWLWSAADFPSPATTRGQGRPAVVRPHRALVELAVHTLSLLCDVRPAEVWRWIYPGRERHIYRHTRRGGTG